MLDNNKKNLSNKANCTGRFRSVLWSLLSVFLFLFVFLPLFKNRITFVNSGSYPVIENASTPTPLPTPKPDLSTGTEPIEETAESENTQGTLQISNYATLKENDTYPAVQLLQTRLIELGYLDGGETSDVYGASTAAAVSLYQRTINAEITGIADRSLQEKLYAEDAATYRMKLGDSGADVKSMQARLSELGYYESKLSGYFGVETENAIKRFQKKNLLGVTGAFGVIDRNLLYSPDARPAVDPTPTPSPTPIPTATPKPKKKSGSSSSSSSSSSGSSGKSSGSSSSVDRSYTASYSADGIVSVAKAQMDKPYVWSEEGPNSFDCSGLVYYCLRTCGVKTSRYSSSGFSAVSNWKNITDIDDLRAGDIVFFKSDTDENVNHTGIYIGSNHFIHASFSSGKVVRSNITGAYWVRNFVNGRRVFG